MEEKKESSLVTSCCSEGEKSESEIKGESEMKNESEGDPKMEWKLEETNGK